jgi:hypothetical protein
MGARCVRKHNQLGDNHSPLRGKINRVMAYETNEGLIVGD